MKRIVSIVMLLMSAAPAMAHNGEHGHLSQWLGHMLTSGDHLLALVGLTIIIGVVASARHIRRRRQRAVEH